jgi:hypothetical protein
MIPLMPRNVHFIRKTAAAWFAFAVIGLVPFAGGEAEPTDLTVVRVLSPAPFWTLAKLLMFLSTVRMAERAMNGRTDMESFPWEQRRLPQDRTINA